MLPPMFPPELNAIPPPGEMVRLDSEKVFATLRAWPPLKSLSGWATTFKLPDVAHGPVNVTVELTTPADLSPGKRRYTATVEVPVDPSLGEPAAGSAENVQVVVERAKLIPGAEASAQVKAFLTVWPGARARLDTREHSRDCIIYEEPKRLESDGRVLGTPRMDWCPPAGMVQVFLPGDYDDPLLAGLASLRPDARLLWVRAWLWPAGGGEGASWHAQATLQTGAGPSEVAAERSGSTWVARP